jgi:hypothetical protein
MVSGDMVFSVESVFHPDNGFQKAKQENHPDNDQGPLLKGNRIFSSV